jgi:hypothetical protein
MNRHDLETSAPVKQPLTKEYLIARRAREGVVSPHVANLVSNLQKRLPRGLDDRIIRRVRPGEGM